MVSRAPGRGSVESATACAVLTFSCMLTEPDGAPMSGAMASATSRPSVHHASSHARTPRSAHSRAYSARLVSTSRGMAPSELLIM